MAVLRARMALGGDLKPENVTLIAIGTGLAWLYSVVATAAPHLFPGRDPAGDGPVPLYFEAAAVITVLVLLGQVRWSPASPSQWARSPVRKSLAVP
jgi:cation transport ATPase